MIPYYSILFVDLGSDAVVKWTRLSCIGRYWSWGVFKGVHALLYCVLIF